MLKSISIWLVQCLVLNHPGDGGTWNSPHQNLSPAIVVSISINVLLRQS